MSDFIYFQTNKLFVYIYKVWTNKKHDKITDHCNSSVMIKKGIDNKLNVDKDEIVMC